MKKRIYRLLILTLLSALLFHHPISAIAAEIGGNEDFTAEEQFEQGRYYLNGQPKNLEEAKRILLDLVERRTDEMNPKTLCRTYIYLGYIEDLNGRRKEAKVFFEKAAAVEDPGSQYLRDLAQKGLKESVTFIERFDENSRSWSPKTWEKAILEREGEFIIASDWGEPPKKPLAVRLTKSERQYNFIRLWDAIDRHYSFFIVKGIDWQEVKERYQQRLNDIENPQDDDARKTKAFYRLINDLVGELHDGHSYILNHAFLKKEPEDCPNFLIERIEGKAVILRVGQGSDAEQSGIKPGTVILSVDGKPADEIVREVQKKQFMEFREGARLQDAYRTMLDGVKNTKVRLEILDPGEMKPREVELVRGPWGPDISFPPAFPVTEGEYTKFGRHPSGYGYIRITSFKGTDKLEKEFLDALMTLADTPGLVIDIRDDPGGSGASHHAIIGPFLKKRTLATVSKRKNGPGHGDFRTQNEYLNNSAGFRYSKPVALLFNYRTGSASDLFTVRMIAAAKPITLGRTTRGNLSGHSVNVILPCGLVVRVSNSYVTDANGRVIEWHGTDPDIPVEPTIEDIAQGRDTVLEAAITELGKRVKGK